MENSLDSKFVLDAIEDISNKLSGIANGIDCLSAAVMANLPPTPEALEGALLGYNDYLDIVIKDLGNLRDEIIKPR